MSDSAESPIDRLRHIMARLRGPGGCPWDQAQDFSTIAPYTIEEAYEVDDAIRRGDMGALRDELGDLLLQVVFHSRMAEEQGDFDFDAVANAIADKLWRRHPHVFGDASYASEEEQTADWEAMKARERAQKGDHSALDDVPLALPALKRAAKLGKRASRVGFDWPDTRGVVDKIHEEVGEIEAEMAAGGDRRRLEEEIGDLLFAVTNLARYLKVDPEKALRGCNARFEERFRHVERRLNEQGRSTESADLDEMDALWDEAKQQGKQDA
ncbi:nucleoside triphosphate pyrophosphohydrolase [Natronospira bacteriovora]|uniref:Nucleoside triphosphate pyrophosphohydrolase n=1 Tax=Natronospira bacteriovora TaxID=3069753 RepID=A0ABU0W9R2_9GAMM|nr:nucleoside triphosphate pyrophosphohydrolase [Natronospira sp. AB-CW4]MDQ2070777.1 nucleoside triphosphate pyrophosphohydrolase [Natronospira sp. AB-CW4]